MDLPESVAVTGAEGFIGSHLVRRLVRCGVRVIPISLESGIDILDRHDLFGVPPFDALVHLAAKIYVPHSRTDIGNFFETNVSGTLNVLELCRQRNSAIVFMSSYVYGQPQRLPVSEDHPVSHWNPYASSKLLGEEACRAYSCNFGLQAVVLRLFNVYGDGQNPDFLVPRIIAGAKAGRITLHSSKPRRDFVHVEDVVEAIVRSMQLETPFSVFNVASGVSHSVRDIVELVTDLVGGVEVSYLEIERENEVLDIVGDWQRIRTELDWRPRIDLKTGIAGLIEGSECDDHG